MQPIRANIVYTLIPDTPKCDGAPRISKAPAHLLAFNGNEDMAGVFLNRIDLNWDRVVLCEM